MQKEIAKFKGEYYFLSNFFDAPVWYNGLLFKNSEAAFHSAKCPERAHEFTDLSPRDAKRLGRRVPLRPDWDSVKLDIMYRVCLCKFEQNKDLGQRLLDTGSAILIEGNTWHDTFWGVDSTTGHGYNHLGHILMRVRACLSDTQRN